jgi:hypothetical protein
MYYCGKDILPNRNAKIATTRQRNVQRSPGAEKGMETTPSGYARNEPLGIIEYILIFVLFVYAVFFLVLVAVLCIICALFRRKERQGIL